MRLKRRLLEQRLRRLMLRANEQTSPAAVQLPVASKASRGAIARRELAQRPEGCRRRSCRIPVDQEVAVKKLGGFGFQLPARDVSPDGCRVELVEMVGAGERVIVRLPALEPLGAQVAWVQGANAGLHFQRALHPAVFDQLLDRLVTCAS